MVNVFQASRIAIFAIILGLLLAGCGDDSRQDNQASGGSGVDSGQGDQASDGNGGETIDRTASLSWNAPLERQNGDSIKMGELSSYLISYGQKPDDLTRTVRIPDAAEAATMQHTITGLSEGTWFFSIQVEDLDGLISPPSQTVNKTI